MSDLKNHMYSVLERTVDVVANNPKVAVLVPAATAAIAPLTRYAEIQGALSIVSMCIGIVISLILLRHHWLKLKETEANHDLLKKRLIAD